MSAVPVVMTCCCIVLVSDRDYIIMLKGIDSILCGVKHLYVCVCSVCALWLMCLIGPVCI